jgi:ubiquinone/menaquinone biosynthesis C-methylase UbiE
MTTADATQFREVVRDQWTHAADAWTRWHPKFSEQSKEVTQLICDAADLKPGQSVLDLAGGTGEPALTVAAAVAPGGSVVCTDFIADMVRAAEGNAKTAGISNMTFRQVDAENIPFDDASFDRVVSRFGVMFFPDVQKALGEIRRVMKPGSRAAFTTWQAVEKNGWFFDINKALAQRGLVQPPPPGMPSPFRFGEAGSFPKELESAGYKDVSERAESIPWSWPGPPEEFLGFAQETFPAWRRGLAETDDKTREEAKAAMLEAIRQYYDGDRTNFGGRIYVVTATS